mmetsp:Transcript_6423/g.11172  ORF Transcript_6423/g.11172 Transcript_6423/m.11172 type:complete len:174 (+) Transcript_6423:1219-1740(+)
MEGEDQEYLTNLACNEARDGNSLDNIAKICGVSVEEVCRLISSKTSISETKVNTIFNMVSQGSSIERISRNTSIPSSTLEAFVPCKKATELLEECKLSILRLRREGWETLTIAQHLGLFEEDVGSQKLKASAALSIQVAVSSTSQSEKSTQTSPKDSPLKVLPKSQIEAVSAH